MAKRRRKPRKKLGNCVQLAVAKMMNLPVWAVPHFVQKSGKLWPDHVIRWAEARGYSVIYTQRQKADAKPMMFLSKSVEGWVNCGPAASGKGHHAVAYVAESRNKDAVCYDAGTKIKAVDSTLVIFKQGRDR